MENKDQQSDKVTDSGGSTSANDNQKKENDKEFDNNLEDYFVSMFPFTPRQYIRQKIDNFKKKGNANEEAEKLMQELLENPSPMDGTWTDDIEDDDVDEKVENWKTLKQMELRAIFPELCPDWLLENLDKIIVFASNVAGNDMIEEMEKMLNRRVEEIFSLPDEDRSSLPTVKEWQARRELQEELEMWSTRITALDLVNMYEDPTSTFYNVDRRNPETNLYKESSLAGLRDEFRFQNAQQISKVFRRSRFFFAPARRTLLQMGNTRKTRRPDKDVQYPSDPCIPFLRERRFTQLEEEINMEVERRRLAKEQEKMEASVAGMLEGCEVCLASDCLPSEMVGCQAGHRFCQKCVVATAEGVLSNGRGVVKCLGQCDKEVEVVHLKRVLSPTMMSRLLENRQAEELRSAELENLVSCPYCPYQTIMDNTEDRVMRCLNPGCGRDSCRMCKLSNHIPLSCEEYQGNTRKKVEEQLTMSLVRQCWNCKVPFQKMSGCYIVTCPLCGKMTCYGCRKPIDHTHNDCNNRFYYRRYEKHEEEIKKAEEKIKEELEEEEKEMLKNLFNPGPGPSSN